MMRLSELINDLLEKQAHCNTLGIDPEVQVRNGAGDMDTFNKDAIYLYFPDENNAVLSIDPSYWWESK